MISMRRLLGRSALLCLILLAVMSVGVVSCGGGGAGGDVVAQGAQAAALCRRLARGERGSQCFTAHEFHAQG
ncbi:MAG: hypothetical protein HC765_10025 [Brachymonas sp.]|nr:hypothetical protein [Brachymonas sp.]